jgi:hypothetical protein
MTVLVRTPILLSCVLALFGQVLAQQEPEPVRRMGAYQCIDCATGGFLTGIRQGGFGRVLREFPPRRRLCVSSYQEIDGEQYVFFQLEPMTAKTDGAWTVRRETSSSGVTASGERYGRVALDDGRWPDGGDWGVKSNSWNAECHDVEAQ